MRELVCAAQGRPVLHPQSCSSLSAWLSPSLKRFMGHSQQPWLVPRGWHKACGINLFSLCLSQTNAHTLWFTGLIAGKPGRTKSGLLLIQLLIALVYELLQFNWTELKVLGFHLLNKSWCVISVMGLDSYSFIKFVSNRQDPLHFPCNYHNMSRSHVRQLSETRHNFQWQRSVFNVCNKYLKRSSAAFLFFLPHLPWIKIQWPYSSFSFKLIYHSVNPPHTYNIYDFTPLFSS